MNEEELYSTVGNLIKEYTEIHEDARDSLKRNIMLAVAKSQLSSLVKLDEELCNAVVDYSTRKYGSTAGITERLKWQERLWHTIIIKKVNTIRERWRL